MSRLLRLNEAARELGVAASTLRTLGDTGRIKTQRDASGYRVFDAEVIAAERLRRLTKRALRQARAWRKGQA